MIVSNWLTNLGSSAFIPVNKFWSHDKLSMYNYELLTIYNEI